MNDPFAITSQQFYQQPPYKQHSLSSESIEHIVHEKKIHLRCFSYIKMYQVDWPV